MVGLPGLEKIESIDADHRAMIRCRGRNDPRYRAIYGVLRQFIAETVEMSDGRHSNFNSPVIDDGASQFSSCNLPFDPNPYFVGRIQILMQLEEIFFNMQHVGHITATVAGLGGIGKTSIAQRYAETVRDNHPGYSIFWMSLSDREAMERTCWQIQRQLDLDVDESCADIKSLVHDHLSSPASGKWLLMVDNVDDEIVMRNLLRYIPRSTWGLRLVTSRNEDVARILCDKILHIDEMGQQEAENLFDASMVQSEVHGSIETSEKVALLRSLNNVPLAITQAAAYMIRNRVPARDYLDMLLGKEEEAIGLLTYDLPDRRRYSGAGSSNAICRTWLVSFEQLRRDDERNGNGAAVRLLLFLSRIEPHNIRRSILPGFQADAETLSRVLGTLQAYAFIRSEGAGTESYSMNKLLHLSIRAWVKRESKAALATELATSHMSHLLQVVLGSSEDGHEQWASILPHALRILAESEGEDIAPRPGLLHIFFQCFNTFAPGSGAFSTDALAVLSSTVVLTQDSILASDEEEAAYYIQFGRSVKAVSVLEHLVDSYPDVSREEILEKIDLYCKLLRVVYHGKLTEAERKARFGDITLSVERFIERSLVEDVNNLSKAKLVIAGRLMACQQADLSTTLITNTIERQYHDSPPNEPGLIQCRQFLGLIFACRGMSLEAISIWEEALTGTTLNLPDESSESYTRLLLTQHSLAKEYTKVGEQEKCCTLCEELILEEVRFWGDEHPMSMETWVRLQHAYRHKGDSDAAAEILDRIVAFHIQNFQKWQDGRLYLLHIFANARGSCHLSPMVRTMYEKRADTLDMEADRRPGWWQIELGMVLADVHRIIEAIRVYEQFLTRQERIAEENQESQENSCLRDLRSDITPEDVERLANNLKTWVLQATAESQRTITPSIRGPTAPHELIQTDSGFFEKDQDSVKDKNLHQEGENEEDSASLVDNKLERGTEADDGAQEQIRLTGIKPHQIRQMIALLKRAVDLTTNHIMSERDPGNLRMHNFLVDALYNSDQVDEAMRVCQLAVALGIKYDNEHDVAHMTAKADMSVLYWKRKREDESVKTMKEVVDVAKRHLEVHHHLLLQWQANMAHLYTRIKRQRLLAAIEIMEHVTKTKAEYVREDDLALAGWWLDLGTLYEKHAEKLYGDKKRRQQEKAATRKGGNKKRRQQEKAINAWEHAFIFVAKKPPDLAFLFIQWRLVCLHCKFSRFEKAGYFFESIVETTRPAPDTPDFRKDEKMESMRALAHCYKEVGLNEKRKEIEAEVQTLKCEISRKSALDLTENASYWSNELGWER